MEPKLKANVVVSWTGGKDGCLSCYKAMSDGFNVTHILNFRDTKKKGSHTINPKLLLARMQTTGIPFIRTDFVSHEQEFKKAPFWGKINCCLVSTSNLRVTDSFLKSKIC